MGKMGKIGIIGTGRIGKAERVIEIIDSLLDGANEIEQNGLRAEVTGFLISLKDVLYTGIEDTTFEEGSHDMGAALKFETLMSLLHQVWLDGYSSSTKKVDRRKGRKSKRKSLSEVYGEVIGVANDEVIDAVH